MLINQSRDYTFNVFRLNPSNQLIIPPIPCNFISVFNSNNYEEQFLDWLIQLIDAETIDLLLVSGNIYDTGEPSTQSQKIYFDFLIKQQQTHVAK